MERRNGEFSMALESNAPCGAVPGISSPSFWGGGGGGGAAAAAMVYTEIPVESKDFGYSAAQGTIR